jgi:hypothetical protein
VRFYGAVVPCDTGELFVKPGGTRVPGQPYPRLLPPLYDFAIRSTRSIEVILVGVDIGMGLMSTGSEDSQICCYREQAAENQFMPVPILIRWPAK